MNLELALAGGQKTRAIYSAPSHQTHSKHPGIVLLHGGGCRDADCEVGAEKYPFWKVFAERLNDMGYGVLRFYRGANEDVETDLAFAAAAIETMKSLPSVDTTRIGLLGHSEGTWQAVEVAARMKEEGLGFLVLCGTFIEDVAVTTKGQVAEVFRPLGSMSEEALQKQMPVLELYFASWGLKENELMELRKEKNLKEAFRRLEAELLLKVNSILESDPKLLSWKRLKSVKEILPTLKLPVFILQGSEDKETPYRFVQDQIEKFGPETRVVPLSGLDHYFTQDKKNGALWENGALRPRRFGPIADLFWVNLGNILKQIDPSRKKLAD